VLLVFDWPAWKSEAQRFRARNAVETTSLEDVRRLLTLHVGADRFNEGHFGEMIRSGHIAAVLRRLAGLTARLRANAGRTRLRVERGDITRVSADAIVNAKNGALSGRAGLDAAVHRAAGPELLAACRELGSCPVGEAQLTPGFRLPARWVIHTVGPVWRGGHVNEGADLASAYRATLSLTLANDCRTVAFPAISCGVNGDRRPSSI